MGSESRSSRDKGTLPSLGVGTGTATVPMPKPGLWARLCGLAEAHPRLLTWAVLAIGMVAILLWASHEQPLLLHQRLVLAAATVGLAGLCAWIIHWE